MRSKPAALLLASLLWGCFGEDREAASHPKMKLAQVAASPITVKVTFYEGISGRVYRVKAESVKLFFTGDVLNGGPVQHHDSLALAFDYAKDSVYVLSPALNPTGATITISGKAEDETGLALSDKLVIDL